MDPGKSGDSEDNCKVCSVANEVCSTGNSHKFHCALCNKCALEDVYYYVDSNVMIIEQLDFYYYNCGSVCESAAYSHLGDFVWLCHECRTKSVESRKTSDDRPTWLDEFSSMMDNKLKVLDEKINSKIDTMAADMTYIKESMCAHSKYVGSYDVSTSSPLRKRKTPNAPLPSPNVGSKRAPPEQLSVSDKTLTVKPMSYKAALKLNNSDAEINASVVKKMTALKTQVNIDVPDFEYKASSNGSINVLVKSYQDALNMKKLLEEKIESLNIKSPIRRNMKKLDVVGLPYNVSKEEAMKGFVEDNPQLGLRICSDDPCAAEVTGNTDLFISVVNVKKLRRKPQYRVLYRATEGLLDKITAPIKLFSCVLHHYILPDKIQCYKCYDFNHFSDQCKSPEVCGICASTSHKTKDCVSKSFKCVNCVRRGLPDDNHAAFSHKCPCFN